MPPSTKLLLFGNKWFQVVVRAAVSPEWCSVSWGKDLTVAVGSYLGASRQPHKCTMIRYCRGKYIGLWRKPTFLLPVCGWIWEHHFLSPILSFLICKVVLLAGGKGFQFVLSLRLQGFSPRKGPGPLDHLSVGQRWVEDKKELQM